MLIKSQSIFILSGLTFFIVDRILKYLFFNNILADSFLLTYVSNAGIAFGLIIPKIFLVLFYIIIFTIIIFLVNWLLQAQQQKKHLDFFSLWLIILGALSNIIDRIKFGFVVDYINLHIWPVFNLADTMIVGGVIFILINYLFLEKSKKL